MIERLRYRVIQLGRRRELEDSWMLGTVSRELRF